MVELLRGISLAAPQPTVWAAVALVDILPLPATAGCVAVMAAVVTAAVSMALLAAVQQVHTESELAAVMAVLLAAAAVLPSIFPRPAAVAAA